VAGAPSRSSEAITRPDVRAAAAGLARDHMASV
jgi:hypothetical protein